MLKKKSKCSIQMEGEEFSIAVRKLVLAFLRGSGVCSIMTSKKMNPSLWKLHLEKERELVGFLFREEM